MAYTTIIADTVGDVGRIALNRPDNLNALNLALTEELAAAIGEMRADGVRALLLTGAGRGFCSGADLAAPPGEGHPSGNDLLRERGLPVQHPTPVLNGPHAHRSCSNVFIITAAKVALCTLGLCL